MTPAQELDSVLRSEVPTESGRRATPGSLPGRKHCDIHGASFLLECRLCTGAILGYGN